MEVSVTELVWGALKQAPSLNSISTHLLLLDQYETKYGIYNHDLETADRPLALVALHDAEDTATNSLLYERMVQFEENQVYKRFGVSWLEFIEQTPDECQRMMGIAIKKQSAEGKMAAEIGAQMGIDK